MLTSGQFAALVLAGGSLVPWCYLRAALNLSPWSIAAITGLDHFGSRRDPYAGGVTWALSRSASGS